MAETERHRDLMIYAIEALKAHFADRPEVYVSGNNFLYWEEGNPKRCVSPDCYVVLGVARHQRDCYMAWREGGKLPEVIFEFTSRKTRREDTDKKQPLYEAVLKVPEYFLYDPTGDYLRPRLQGYRLAEGRYVPIDPVDGRLCSERLGLEIVEEDDEFFFVEPRGRRRLLTPLEEALRAKAEARRADTEARRANTEARRADAEAAGRALAEAEIARLRAELEALRQNSA